MGWVLVCAHACKSAAKAVPHVVRRVAHHWPKTIGKKIAVAAVSGTLVGGGVGVAQRNCGCIWTWVPDRIAPGMTPESIRILRPYWPGTPDFRVPLPPILAPGPGDLPEQLPLPPDDLLLLLPPPGKTVMGHFQWPAGPNDEDIIMPPHATKIAAPSMSLTIVALGCLLIIARIVLRQPNKNVATVEGIILVLAVIAPLILAMALI